MTDTTRLGNALLLAALIVNFSFPAGWQQRTLADDPPATPRNNGDPMVFWQAQAQLAAIAIGVEAGALRIQGERSDGDLLATSPDGAPVTVEVLRMSPGAVVIPVLLDNALDAAARLELAEVRVIWATLNTRVGGADVIGYHAVPLTSTDEGEPLLIPLYTYGMSPTLDDGQVALNRARLLDQLYAPALDWEWSVPFDAAGGDAGLAQPCDPQYTPCEICADGTEWCQGCDSEVQNLDAAFRLCRDQAQRLFEAKLAAGIGGLALSAAMCILRAIWLASNPVGWAVIATCVGVAILSLGWLLDAWIEWREELLRCAEDWDFAVDQRRAEVCGEEP